MAASATSTSSGYSSPRTPKPPPTWASRSTTREGGRPSILAKASRFWNGTLAAPRNSSVCV